MACYYPGHISHARSQANTSPPSPPPPQTYSVHSDSVWSLLAPDDCSVMLSGGRDRCVYRTHLHSRTAELLLLEKEPIRKLALSRTGSSLSLWAATSSSTVNKWSIADTPTNKPGAERKSFTGRGAVCMGASRSWVGGRCAWGGGARHSWVGERCAWGGRA